MTSWLHTREPCRSDIYREFVADLVCTGLLSAADCRGLGDYQLLHHIDLERHISLLQEVRFGMSVLLSRVAQLTQLGILPARGYSLAWTRSVCRTARRQLHT